MEQRVPLIINIVFTAVGAHSHTEGEKEISTRTDKLPAEKLSQLNTVKINSIHPPPCPLQCVSNN